MGVGARDRVGEERGRLLVLGRKPNGPSGDSRWECLCVCGNTTVVTGHSLDSGNTRSCGCLRIEMAAVPPKGHFKKEVLYRSAHTRVTRERGLAKDHPCADCQGRADEWAYDGGDPEELVQEDVPGGAGGKATLHYSCDPSYYSPLCRGCHIRRDRGAAA